MGHWSIYIEGTGPDHTEDPDDVDALFHEFVEDLDELGQSVSHATITIGAREYCSVDHPPLEVAHHPV